MRRCIVDRGDLGRGGSNTSGKTCTRSQAGTARAGSSSSAGRSPCTSATGRTSCATRRTCCTTRRTRSTSATRSQDRAAGTLSAAGSRIPCTAGSLRSAARGISTTDADSRAVRSAVCAPASTANRRPDRRSAGRRDPATDAAPTSAADGRSNRRPAGCRNPTTDAGILRTARRPAPASSAGHGI